MNSLVINIFIVLLNTCILVNLTTAETGKYKINQHFILSYMIKNKKASPNNCNLLLFKRIGKNDVHTYYYDRKLILFRLRLFQLTHIIC